MNLYFILEGEKTEILLYPKWISYVLPDYSQVDFENQVIKNNFYIFSGGGIPSIYNHTVNAIKNINDNPVFDRLIVCLDGEEIGIEGRIKEIKDYIEKSKVILNENCKLDFVVQNVCVETWFLGNRKIVKKNPDGTLLKEFKIFYDVSTNDPEELDLMKGFRNKAHFHYSYFREILKEHYNLVYKKSQPKVVLEKTFFDELEIRITETNHLSSFKQLITLLYQIKSEK
ncbi:hypothetical protein [Flavobacterium caseinilyticum]|uniref:DUF4276 family protein n=1 Tax=Flavobacterium caseinilyticum TaxID=2541732 RepID=A0A4R5AUB6_9FLAO|nr:hypothetical protein [Flavobacterium caseinilyticum]TDD76928.1 hypothetical protein E0F89_04830 [Flavobacterium caseinilyticum]